MKYVRDKGLWVITLLCNHNCIPLGLQGNSLENDQNWVNIISATYIGNYHFHFRFYFETLENSRYRETEYSFIAP